MNGVVAILVFVFGIVVVAIGLHEFGHYWTARRFGMRADRYFLGFGPTVWSTRRGETEFGIKALPLGGFVRIQGMNPGDDRLAPVAETVFARDAVAADRRTDADRTGGDLLAQPAVPPASWDRLHRELGRRGLPDDLARRLVDRARAEAGAEPTAEEARRATVAAAEALLEDSGHPGSLRHRVLHGDEGRFFHDRPARERAVVLVAGSAMHFVQAVVLLFVGFWLFGDAVALPVVQAIQDDSAAAEAGLQPGDELVALDGRSVEEFETIRNYIRARPDEPIELTVRRDERELTLSATPTRETRDGETFGLLGFVPEQETRALPLDEAVRETFTGNGGIASLSVQTVEALGRVFGPDGLGSLFATVAGEEQRDLQGAASPVGLARSTAEGTERFGPLFLLLTLASINVFVGIFNMVPLPPLDGGHIAVLGAEKLVNATRRARGQPQDFTVDPRAVAAVAVPVLVLLGTVFVTVLWLDIVNPIELPQ